MAAGIDTDCQWWVVEECLELHFWDYQVPSECKSFNNVRLTETLSRVFTMDHFYSHSVLFHRHQSVSFSCCVCLFVHCFSVSGCMLFCQTFTPRLQPMVNGGLIFNIQGEAYLMCNSKPTNRKQLF